MAFDLSTLKTLFKAQTIIASDAEVFLGVDIGASSIKVVQIKNVRNVPTLETYGELQLGPYEGVDIGRGTHLPQNKLVEALVDILRESGATGKQVGYAFSYNASFTNTIIIPTLDQKQIPPMLPVEARKYIPISLSKVTLDWVALGTDEKEKNSKILLTAVYNEAIEKYESIMKGVGLTTIAREIEIFSTIRSVISPRDEVVVILDWGASSTRLYIIDKGVVRKTHSVLISGTELTNILAKNLKIDFAVAEEAKRTYGLAGNNNEIRIQKLLIQGIERGLHELNTVITRYERDEKVTVSKIIFSGGGSLLNGLDTYVEDMFSHSVEKANPFSKVAYPAFLEDILIVAGPSFSVAIGTALRALQNTQ